MFLDMLVLPRRSWNGSALFRIVTDCATRLLWSDESSAEVYASVDIRDSNIWQRVDGQLNHQTLSA
jgi:hypothetical protein